MHWRSTFLAAIGAAAIAGAATAEDLSQERATPIAPAEEAAQRPQGDPEAEKTLDEIVMQSKTVEDGAVQPSTGRAKPVENWFGCKPETGDADSGACDPSLTDNPQKPDDEEVTEEAATEAAPEDEAKAN